MAEGLFPVAEVPEFLPESAGYDTEYRRSIKWNTAAGDFVRDGANRVAGCNGQEAFAVWCFKTAQTERYRCLAYPDSIGAEMECTAAYDDESTVESMVQRAVTEALLVNPRTEEVWDFSFSRDGDCLHCTFKVRGILWDAEIEISI